LKNKLRDVLLVVACVMVGIGLFNGEYTAVYEKAVRICLECIGIG
jgi:hypothetical protein